ncbi:oligoribonuclease [Paenibacillus dendritiformis]|uniref:oligoribonuclease n=1 Tax=Paenibacillus dendritiformis TaxID=130049 RepID=UPI000DA9ADBF|nr:oligoribonuclease [Paenibacillus dendritiformis]PZM63644.1 oligoribonuclease [Paenibacillus dendritiformis]
MAEAKEVKTTKKAKPEATYSKQEIMAAAAGFGVSPDVMAGALRRVDKSTLTRAEVERAIQDFKKRQV